MLIRDIIESIKNTAGSNAKRAILEANKSELFDLIFADTYDKSRNYYVKKYDNDPFTLFDVDHQYLTIDANYDVFHNMLERLNSREITGNAAIALVEDTIASFAEEDRPILNAIMDRNLKIGIAAESFNKTTDDALNKFEVALAFNLDKVKNVNPIDGTYFASRKLDGVRCIAIVDTNAQEVKFMSRQGKEFLSLSRLVQPMLDLCSQYSGTMVFDGELCAVDKNGNEDFAGAVKRVTKKDQQATDIKYCIFDIIPYEAFLAGEDKREHINFPFSDRYRQYTEMYMENMYVGDVAKYIMPLVQERILTQEDFDKWTDAVSENGWEGFMLRKDAPYKAGRIKDLIKVKKFQDAEYVVEDVINGTAVYNEGGMKEYNIVSALVIRHKDNIVKVGSGLSKEQRLRWFGNPEEIIGKTITVQYFEETQDSKTKEYSLRFPVLKYVYDEGRDC